MKNKRIKDNKYLYVGYLLIIGVIFYVMNVFTPFYADDWHFKYIFDTQTQVKSLGDLLYSLYLHYLNYTGRTFPHFFVQLFDGILGKTVFNLFNAGILILFLHLLSTTVSDTKNARYVYLSVSVFFFFIVINGFADEFLWMSGACNYLWCATLLLLFNRVFQKEISSNYYYPLLFILGILTGWTNEVLVVGMVVAFLVYIWDNRGKINRSQVFMIIGFFIGAGFLVCSPSAYNRFEMNNQHTLSVSSSVQSYIQAFYNMVDLRILPILLVLLIILYIAKKVDTADVVKKNKYLWVCLFISFLFIVFTKENSHRSRFGIEFFALVFLLQLIAIIKVPQRLIHLINIGVLVICFFAILYTNKNYSDYKNVMAQVEQGKELVLTNEPEVPSYFRRFLMYYTDPEYAEEYGAFLKNNIYNTLIARYFGVDSVVFLPERLINALKENPDQYNEFSSSPNLPFYIRKHDGRRIRRVSVVIDKADEKDIPFYKRPFARKNPIYAASRITLNKYAVVTIENTPYLIVKKLNQYDEKRIKAINVD